MNRVRRRYITICQLVLTSTVAAAVGASAVGAMAVQIVAPDAGIPGAVSASDLVQAVSLGEGYVAQAAVTPVVREVRVAPLPVFARAATRVPAVVVTPSGASARVAPVRRLAALSAPTKVRGYATVGVTWQPGTHLTESQIWVQVRTESGGVWSGWTTAAYHDDHGPDARTSEAATVRPGTDPLVIGAVDQVQMRAETLDGNAPTDIKLAVIDPGTGTVTKASPAINTADLPASDRLATGSAPIESTTAATATGQGTAVGSTHGDSAALMAMKVAPKPMIYSRAQWGANESMRDPSSLHYGTVKAGFIHHTVNANDYTSEQVPALIRGIYAYHTQARGWSDIGYNFLIDRFGKIWEGRYGGVNRAVVGAHTLGYNEVSFGASAIGDFDIAEPPQAVLDAYARLFAWKLSLYNIRADAAHLLVKNLYLHAINGHRDANPDICPGQYLYAKIPAIRTAAQAIQDTGINPTSPPPPTDPVNLPVVGAPKDTPLPTTKPLRAFVQPAVTFPSQRYIVGAAYADIVTKSASGAIAVLPTGGMLGFAPAVASPGNWSTMGLIAAVGDVTGDGHPDVIAKTAKTGYARVYRSDGNGHISSSQIAGGTSFRTADMILGVGDLNHDGHVDVLTRDRRTGALMFDAGLGHGQFAAATLIRRSWPYTVSAAGDLNGDGKIDLLAVRSDGALLYLAGKGGTTPDKSFAAPKVLRMLPSPATAVAVGPDATGDKKPDVMVRFADGLVTLYAGTGGAALGQQWGPFSGTAGLNSLSSAQMMGTSSPDFVGKDARGNLEVVSLNGKANLGTPLGTNLYVPSASQILSVGDWTRSGHADVITRDQGGDRLVLRPGLGNGRFGRGRSLGNGWWSVTLLAAAGDVPGDGYPDLIGRIGSGRLIVFPGAGLKAFKAPLMAPTSLRTFNIVGSGTWGSHGPAFRSTDGTFVPYAGKDPESALRAANGPASSTYDTYIGIGDVNGDGVPDLLVRETGTGTLWLLPGMATGGFGPRMWVANGLGAYQLID
jgi:hypothetical protein